MKKAPFKVGQSVSRVKRWGWCLCKGSRAPKPCADCRGPLTVTVVRRGTCQSGWLVSVQNPRTHKVLRGYDSTYFRRRVS